MDPLPWEGCNNDWNSELCWNGTKFNSSQDQEANNKTSAPQEFYEYIFTLKIIIFVGFLNKRSCISTQQPFVTDD